MADSYGLCQKVKGERSNWGVQKAYEKSMTLKRRFLISAHHLGFIFEIRKLVPGMAIMQRGPYGLVRGVEVKNEQIFGVQKAF